MDKKTNDAILPELIQEKVNNFFQIKYYEKVSSTNDMLKQMAEEGINEGTVIIAETQTSGKGRKGRSFYSPAQSGIYMSILLRPDFTADNGVLLTPMTAVVVAESIEKVTNKKAEIKWVNDVLIDGKKVCGILTEASFSPSNNGFDYIIVGIGINICDPEHGFPEEIKNIAGSVFSNVEEIPDRNRVIIELLNCFCSYYDTLNACDFYTEYRSRLSFLGDFVHVLSATGERTVRALDITEDFHLIVQNEDGSIGELVSGEISIRP